MCAVGKYKFLPKWQMKVFQIGINILYYDDAERYRYIHQGSDICGDKWVW